MYHAQMVALAIGHQKRKRLLYGTPEDDLSTGETIAAKQPGGSKSLAQTIRLLVATLASKIARHSDQGREPGDITASGEHRQVSLG